MISINYNVEKKILKKDKNKPVAQFDTIHAADLYFFSVTIIRLTL